MSRSSPPPPPTPIIPGSAEKSALFFVHTVCRKFLIYHVYHVYMTWRLKRVIETIKGIQEGTFFKVSMFVPGLGLYVCVAGVLLCLCFAYVYVYILVIIRVVSNSLKL